MTNKIKLKLKPAIFPIYQKLLSESEFNNICTFAVQWGKEFPIKDNKGILFVGKAVNGWITNNQNVEKLFSKENKEKIFNRKEQIEWVDKLSGNKKGYNPRKSAFWRLIKKVSETYYPKEWYSNIAWTNLYKIAPWSGGNPSLKMQKQQRSYCIDILKSEIDILKPEYVIMLTSNWEWFFTQELNKQDKLKQVATREWCGYKTTMSIKDDVKYIISHHPQGKNEQKHKEAIIELMKIEI